MLEIQDVLSLIGVQTNGKVRVLLVGFPTKENPRHDICIEPADGAFVVDDLRSIERKTEEALKRDPESQIEISHPRIREQRRRELFYRSSTTTTVWRKIRLMLPV